MKVIDPSFYLQNQQKERAPSPDLGKDEFMKILMTQLQNQDPLKPMEDREFISQMASFSSLEQMMNISNSINTLVQKQNISPIMQYSHLIDKQVSYQAYDQETGEKLGINTSNVISVSQHEGRAVLELKSGEKIYTDAITEISNPNAEADSGADDTPASSGVSGKGSEI